MSVRRSAICSGSAFCKDLESASPDPAAGFPSVRIPVVVGCTVVVFVLFVAGTAATAISFPPALAGPSEAARATALDGDLKLLGPLLLTAGCFLLVVDVALCALVTRASYRVAPQPPFEGGRPIPVAVAGGPFYIVTTDPIVTQPLYGRPGGWGRQSPNAPLPDLSPQGCGGKARAATATVARGRQPAFNPNVQLTDGDP